MLVMHHEDGASRVQIFLRNSEDKESGCCGYHQLVVPEFSPLGGLLAPTLFCDCLLARDFGWNRIVLLAADFMVVP